MTSIVHYATKTISKDACEPTSHIQDHIEKPVRGRSRETALSCIYLRHRRHQIDQSTPGLRLVVGTAHSKSQRSMANLQRIFPQAEITIGDAFDFKVQRFYFADEIVTKEFCGIEKVYLKEGISTCGCGKKNCSTPHHPAFDCVKWQCC